MKNFMSFGGLLTMALSFVMACAAYLTNKEELVFGSFYLLAYAYVTFYIANNNIRD